MRDSSFDQLHTSIVISSSTDSLVTRNKMTNIWSDGVNVADSHRVIVSNNSCAGNSPSAGAHPDCVQLWGLLNKPVQSAIVLLNNVAEGAMQGFTSFDQSAYSGKNLVFAGNLGKISYPQGLACYGCRDSLFLGNTLVTLPGSPWEVRINTPNGVNNVFENNRTFNYRSGTLTDVQSVAHEFSTYKPSFTAGSDFDLKGIGATVPEPGTWLQLISGFGLIGLYMRGRRRQDRLRTVYA